MLLRFAVFTLFFIFISEGLCTDKGKPNLEEFITNFDVDFSRSVVGRTQARDVLKSAIARLIQNSTINKPSREVITFTGGSGLGKTLSVQSAIYQAEDYGISLKAHIFPGNRFSSTLLSNRPAHSPQTNNENYHFDDPKYGNELPKMVVFDDSDQISDEDLAFVWSGILRNSHQASIDGYSNIFNSRNILFIFVKFDPSARSNNNQFYYENEQKNIKALLDSESEEGTNFQDKSLNDLIRGIFPFSNLVVFNPFTPQEMQQLAERKINKLRLKAESLGIYFNEDRYSTGNLIAGKVDWAQGWIKFGARQMDSTYSQWNTELLEAASVIK